jgi:threonine dehydratase
MTDVAAIRAAAGRARGIRVTPLLESPELDRLAGRRVLVKAECLQVTGSFKARGAWAAISALSAAERRQGVLAYSSGNHAQGVAWAAAAHRTPAVIVMPSDAPAVKIEGTRGYGAEVVLYERGRDDRDALGARLAAERGLTLVPPFDHAEVIAGQGTVGLELAEQVRAAGVERADVLVPCGGGGLSAGIALALEAEAPGLRVRTTEPAGFDDMARSLAAGERLANPAAAGSICDAILTPRPGALTFPVLQRLAGPGLAVSDDEALAAVEAALRHLHIVLEPGGAVALAAALFRPEAVEGEAVVCVASGGNVAAETFARAISGRQP